MQSAPGPKKQAGVSENRAEVHAADKLIFPGDLQNGSDAFSSVDAPEENDGSQGVIGYFGNGDRSHPTGRADGDTFPKCRINSFRIIGEDQWGPVLVRANLSRGVQIQIGMQMLACCFA